MKTYTIKGGFTTQRVKGEPIKLPGIKGYEFFVHKQAFSDETGYAVSEKSTGCSIGHYSNMSKTGAIKLATSRAKKFKQKGFDSLIKKRLRIINDPFEKAIKESDITLTELEKHYLKLALKKYKLIK